jgi:hypothetical protein
VSGNRGDEDGPVDAGLDLNLIAIPFRAGYDSKEVAEEAVFFHKEDEKILKKLLSKVRAQAEANDTHNAAGARAAELSSLNSIVGSKLSDAEKEKLIEWKHTH